MVYCHENKVWYWVLFLSYLTRWREIETAILASYPSAAEALVLVLNRVRNSPRRTHRDDGTVTFYTLCAVDQSLIAHSLKGEATLPGSSQCQLEVCQSAVAKPPFERGFEAQLSSHHPLFLSPNSRVTVMSYQDRQELPRPTIISMFCYLFYVR